MNNEERTDENVEEVEEVEEVEVEVRPKRKTVVYTPEQLERKRASIKRALEAKKNKREQMKNELETLQNKVNEIEKKPKQPIYNKSKNTPEVEGLKNDIEELKNLIKSMGQTKDPIKQVIEEPVNQVNKLSFPDLINGSYREKLNNDLRQQMMKRTLDNLFDY